MNLISKIALLAVFAAAPVWAEKQAPIRIGVQAGGTSGWELAAMASMDKGRYGFDLITQQLANAEAGKIALQSGAVDLIISDWIWVSRMRSNGADFKFYPYSTTSGALVVPESSPIKTLADLKGKRFGIAGGEFDKNWLLLKALAKKQGFEIDDGVEKIYGAPPLISEQLKLGRIDAALTYWHFAARLEAGGYRQLIDGKGILQGLGINEPFANLGYVFRESWASENKSTINEFLRGGEAAKKTLCADDAVWQAVISQLKHDDAKTQAVLRARYCEGIAIPDAVAQEKAAERIFPILREFSGRQLTGAAVALEPGTFWKID